MIKLLYNDGLKIKTLENGIVKEFASDFHDNYIISAKKAAKNTEWKTQGEGARFMGTRKAEVDVEKSDRSYINSLDFSSSPDKIIYSITVNDLSGIMIKDLTAEKDGESHVIHSRELVFNGAAPSKEENKFVTCVKDNYVNSHLAVFDFDTDDYITVTEGDSADFDAVYSQSNPHVIIFSSKGAGRDGDGEFVRYAPASILSYNTLTGEIDEVLSDKTKSFVKPKDDKNGNLYFIINPMQEKKRGFFRTLLDIILIPWKLLKAIFNFFELFTTVFTGKGFTEKSDNPAKTRDKSEKELVIEDNLINVEEEYKNNLRHKEAFAGIAPWGRKLVKRLPDGSFETIKNGVFDYCLTDEGSIVYTNGKYIVKITADGKCEKLADASLCTRISVYNE